MKSVSFLHEARQIKGMRLVEESVPMLRGVSVIVEVVLLLVVHQPKHFLKDGCEPRFRRSEFLLCHGHPSPVVVRRVQTIVDIAHFLEYCRIRLRGKSHLVVRHRANSPSRGFDSFPRFARETRKCRSIMSSVLTGIASTSWSGIKATQEVDAALIGALNGS